MARRLRLAFDEPAALRAEYDSNIVRGGAFVAGADPCDLREIVEVELDLAFCGERLVFEAEVVHVVPGASGCDVAVQFLCDASVLRERVAPFVETPTGRDDAWDLEEAGAPSRPDARRPRRAPASPPGAALDLEVALEEPVFGEAGSGAGGDGALFGEAGSDLGATAPAERRGARRGEARIPATVAATHVELDGRTRNLSETGVLISADASELPLGKAVALSLRHPETGERVQVAGKVIRHEEGEGAVAAVAIAFEGPRGDPALAAFVEAARESEARRQREGIHGRIEELGMANLLQMLAQSSRQGTLTVRRGSEEGVVAFEAGRLRYARLGAARGRKAMVRLMAWPEGRFVFTSAVDALDEEDEPMPLEALLLDAARAFDEAAAAGPSLAPSARFRMDREALAACGSLSKIEEAVVDLAGAAFSLRRMLDVIPEDDAEIRHAVAALLEKGVLRPADRR